MVGVGVISAAPVDAGYDGPRSPVHVRNLRKAAIAVPAMAYVLRFGVGRGQAWAMLGWRPECLRSRQFARPSGDADAIGPIASVLLRCSVTSRRATFDGSRSCDLHLALRPLLSRIADSRQWV